MKPIRLSQGRLRSLIREAIQHKPLGEAEHAYGQDVNSDLEAAIDAFAMKLHEHFNGFYAANYNDVGPDREAEAQDEWDMQVEHAVDEVTLELQSVIGNVQNKLINGEYYGR